MSVSRHVSGPRLRVVLGAPIETVLTEVYSSIARIADHSECGSFVRSESARLLQRMRDSDRGASSPALLPLLVYEGVGGAAREGTWSAAAWLGLYITGKLLDDLADGEGALAEQAGGGVPRLVDLATNFWTVAELCLCELPADVYLDVVRPFHKTIQRMVKGQQHGGIPSEASLLAACMKAAGEKSGSFFELAAYIGARCGTADRPVIQRFGEFGYEVGMMVQLLDDLKDFRQRGREGDLANGRLTIPTAYALEVAQPQEREELRELLTAAVGDMQAEDRARRMINKLGAEVFVAAEVARHRHRALLALEGSGVHPDSAGRLRNWLTLILEES